MDSDDKLFSASLDNVSMFANILKGISFKNIATLTITQNGLKFTTEEARSVQASAFIKASVFQDYELADDDEIIFCINLAALLECVQLFSGYTHAQPAHNSSLVPATNMKISYAGEGHGLKVLLHEPSVITECQLKTIEPDDLMDFKFAAENVVSKLVVKADLMKELFQDMDTTSDFLEIAIWPEPFRMRFSTNGNIGSIDFNLVKSEVSGLEQAECCGHQVFSYRMSLLKPCSRAIGIAEKVALRVDQRGCLSLQFLISQQLPDACFVEYLVGLCLKTSFEYFSFLC